MPRIPCRPLHFMGLPLLSLLGVTSAMAASIRVPAHVFPDPRSDIVTYVEIPGSGVASAFPRVLDAGLEGEWYWSTYEGDFVGYVAKHEVIGRNKLREGTLIRTNPTVRSWVLTRYAPDDRVNVRSRLAVGRVAFNKRIPVYFQASAAAEIPGVPVQKDRESTRPETTGPTLPAQPSQLVEHESPQQSPDEELQPSQAQPSRIAVVPELPGSPEALPAEATDPLLEEQPRISGQDLANLAPPPTDIFQEFEGYLKLVPGDDPLSSRFDYQLVTRSGRRIVYVSLDHLRSVSHDEFIDQWINIRGSLEEVGGDFTLYIEARSIWVAPE
jgi:hypothetical protein